MKKNIYFGVFTKGKLVFQIWNSCFCSDELASYLVSLLDTKKDVLMPNHYFAYDYIENK